VVAVMKESKMKNLILRWKLKMIEGEHVQTPELRQSKKEKEVLTTELNASRESIEALK